MKRGLLLWGGGGNLTIHFSSILLAPCFSDPSKIYENKWEWLELSKPLFRKEYYERDKNNKFQNIDFWNNCNSWENNFALFIHYQLYELAYYAHYVYYEYFGYCT